jgi:hypothetical protein
MNETSDMRSWYERHQTDQSHRLLSIAYFVSKGKNKHERGDATGIYPVKSLLIPKSPFIAEHTCLQHNKQTITTQGRGRNQDNVEETGIKQERILRPAKKNPKRNSIHPPNQAHSNYSKDLTLESGIEPKASLTLARSLIGATFVNHCDTVFFYNDRMLEELRHGLNRLGQEGGRSQVGPECCCVHMTFGVREQLPL